MNDGEKRSLRSQKASSNKCTSD